MKKTFVALSAALLMLCAACSTPVSVEGTWYSVTDTTMYNFKDNEITASGVTVGQYEDNGDSVVISMMDTGKNMQLYVTTVDGVDVLADVKEGEGTYYFCKGLENAQAFAKAEEMEQLRAYIEENLFAEWSVINPSAAYDRIMIERDNRILTQKDGNVGEAFWIDLSIGTVDESFGSYESGQVCAFLKVADDLNGTNAFDIPIVRADFGDDREYLKFGELIVIKADS